MAWNPNIPTVTNRVQDDLDAIRENFQHLDPLAQAVGELQTVSGLASVAGELQAVSGLAPYVQAILGSRIVDHNLDVADPPNGYYVRWENGLAINMVWGWVTGDGTSQALSQSKTMPSSMLLVTAITASSAGFKTGSDPTSLQDNSGVADREVVFARVASSPSITVSVRRVDETIIPNGTRILWSAIIVGRWK